MESRPAGVWRLGLAPCAATLLLMVCTWLAAGRSLGLFFGGVFLASILIPPITLLGERAFARLVLSLAIVDGVGLVWLIACTTGAISLVQWLGCYLILLAFAALLTGCAAALARCRIHPVLASAVTVVFALLWLAWPVWLSSFLREVGSQRLLNALVQISPMLAMNGLLLQFGPWSQGPIAYHLTDLGQNIAYVLPAHGIVCIAMHAVFGVLLLAMTRNYRVKHDAR